MILTFILTLASNFFLGLVGVTSGIASLPSQLTDAMTYAINALGTLDYIIPAAPIIIALSTVVVYEGAVYLFKAGVWIYRHIPFIGH